MYEDEDKTHCGDRSNVTPRPWMVENTVPESRYTVLGRADDRNAGLSRKAHSLFLQCIGYFTSLSYMRFLMAKYSLSTALFFKFEVVQQLCLNLQYSLPGRKIPGQVARFSMDIFI